MPRSKADLVRGLAAVLGIVPPPMSTGSTEPKAILIAANEQLGLGPEALKAEVGRGHLRVSGHRLGPVVLVKRLDRHEGGSS
jgi:hypothetical protein